MTLQGNREQRSNFKWNRVQRQYWRTWNIRKQFSILGEQGIKGTVIPKGGLINVPIFKPSSSLFVCSSVCQHVILKCVSEAMTAVNVKTCIIIVLIRYNL